MEKELKYLMGKIGDDFPHWSEYAIESKAREFLKQRFKKNSEGKYIPIDGIASDLDIDEFYNLMKVKGSLPMKPDLNQIAKASLDRYKNFKYQFNLVATAEIVEESDSPALLSYIAEKNNLKNKKPSDFILLKSVLATSLPFVNKNGDAFKPDDLVEAVASGQMDKFQPAIIDWRHNFQPMGNTIGAEIIETQVDVDGVGKQDVKQIVVYSVFYSWLYPEEGDKIRQWAKKGVLTFSMACGADDIEWINGMNRVLIKPQFIANSIIPPDIDPADRNAKLKSIAEKNDVKSENKQEDDDMNIDELKAKIAELEGTISAQAEKIKEFETSELAKEKKLVETELAEAKESLESIQAEKDELKSKLDEAVAKAESDKAAYDELEAKYNEASESIKKIRQAEVDSINEARKAEVSKFVEAEEVEYWLEKYTAGLNEDGEIADSKDDYDRFIALFKKEEGSEEDEEELATAEADDSTEEEYEDAEKSELVDKSSEAVVATARKKEKSKKVSNTWA